MEEGPLPMLLCNLHRGQLRLQPSPIAVGAGYVAQKEGAYRQPPGWVVEEAGNTGCDPVPKTKSKRAQ